MHIRFQFLIGSLQTDHMGDNVTGTFEFQFLIGSLQTSHLHGWLRQNAGFQFLIGSLQTADRPSQTAVMVPGFNSL